MGKHIVLTGRVQGVGFRYFTQMQAHKYNIKGIVRNLPDYFVEIFCEGEEKNLTHFIEIIKSGPVLSRITKIHIEEYPYKGYTEFQIKG